MRNGCNLWQPTQGESSTGISVVRVHRSPLHFVTYIFSLQSATLYKLLQLEILQYAGISVLGRIRCIKPKYDRILRGGSKVPQRWFIDPTNVGPQTCGTNDPKIYFFSQKVFSHFLKLYPTVFLYADSGRDDYYSC